MPQRIDVKEYSTFGPQGNALAQYNSALGIVRTKGLALPAFNLSYGGSSHFVQDITVQAGTPSNPRDDTFSFPLTASMSDNSGNQAVSTATFSAPAVLAGRNDDTTLKLMTGTVFPGTPENFNFGQALRQAYVVLGGFTATYGNTDHKVLSLEARADFEASTSTTGVQTLTVVGGATIKDSSAHTGTGAVQALVLGQVAGDPTQFAAKTWNSGDGRVTINLSGLANTINQAVVFIKRFSLSYVGSSDQSVRTIQIDAGNNSLNITNVPGAKKAPGSAIITFTPNLIMTDGNNNATGTLELLVMAVPDAAA